MSHTDEDEGRTTRPMTYHEMIADAEEMLRHTRSFLERASSPVVRARIEGIAAKLELDIERYRLKQEEHTAP